MALITGLGIPNKGAWQATVHAVTESDMTELLNKSAELLNKPHTADSLCCTADTNTAL